MNSFFPNACRRQGRQDVRDLLDRLSRSTGKHTVSVSHCKGMKNFSGGNEHNPNSQRVVLTFDLIRAVLDFELENAFFTLGNTILKMRDGLIQGNELSEPIAAAMMHARTRKLRDRAFL